MPLVLHVRVVCKGETYEPMVFLPIVPFLPA